jgi:MFS family permease
MLSLSGAGRRACDDKWVRGSLGIIFLIVFLDMMGAGILIPVIPFVVQPYRADALTVGLLALAFSAAQFAASPLLGAWSDRVGRRPVLLVCLLGTATGYFLFGLAGSLPMLFIARLLAGFAGGSISTAQAYIADVSEPADRAKNFGLIGAAFGLGFILGPALGGILSHVSLSAPAFGSAILSLVTFAVASLLLKESLHGPAEKGPGPRAVNPFGRIGAALARPHLRPLMAAIFALNFAMAGMQTNFAVFTRVRFGFGAAQNAYVFAYLGVMSTLTQGVLLRKLAHKVDEAHLSAAGAFAFGIGFVFLALSSSIWMIYVAITFQAFGFGLATPSLSGLISRRCGAAEQGTMLGTSQSVASLTRVLGPVWAGFLFDRLMPAAPYWSGVVWSGLALICAWQASKSGPATALTGQ